MLRAAILARKSTDDNDKHEDNKSVTRQVERARAYAAAKGWTVADEHVYIDDDIAGWEFKNRPGLLRLLNHLKEIDIVVMSEFSRLGREQSNAATILAQIHAAGTRIFFYLTDEELRYESALDKFMVGAVSFAAELEREKASQRARDALARKAERGYNAGGCVYGYDNVPVYGPAVNGQPVRTHTDYRINESQAEIIRGIFRAYIDGRGLGPIAKAMNADPAYTGISEKYFGAHRVPPARKSTGSWAPSSVREILRRPRYTGKVPYGEYRKTLRGGTQARLRQAEYLLAERPDLRIVSEDLWRAVQARLESRRREYRGPARRVESKYLLSGLLRCDHCGGPMIATTVAIGQPGKRRRTLRYACSYAKSRGATVCANRLRPPMELLEAQVLDAIEDAVLSPAALRRVLDLVAARAKAARQQKQKPDTAAEAAKIRNELDHLIALTVSGRAPARVLEEIERREQRLRELTRADTDGDDPGKIFDRARIERLALERLADFRGLLRSNPIDGRHALQQLLAAPILFAARAGGWYEFRGTTHVGSLLPTRLDGASPRRFELLSPP